MDVQGAVLTMQLQKHGTYLPMAKASQLVVATTSLVLEFASTCSKGSMTVAA